MDQASCCISLLVSWSKMPNLEGKVAIITGEIVINLIGIIISLHIAANNA